MQARLVLVVETTNEQSISFCFESFCFESFCFESFCFESFCFEQLDIPVVATGEPVNGIGCGARHARQSR